MKNRWQKWIDVFVFAFVTGGAIGIAWTGAGTGRQSVDRAVAHAEAGVKKVDRAIAIDRYESLPQAQSLAGIEGLARAIKTEWSPKRTDRKTPEVAAYHPGTLDDTRTGREIELRLLAPTTPTAVAEPGSITIHWNNNDRTTANIVNYVVYRTVLGTVGTPDGAEEVVATPPADNATYIDTNVKAGVTYGYRVSAKTEEPTLVRSGQAESAKSEVVRQRASRDFEIRLIKANDTTKTMRFLVRRLVRDVWYEKEFDGAIGQTIGAVDPGASVDYGTGCKVLELSTVHETTNEVREDVAFAADGTVIVVNGIVQKKSVQVPKDVVSFVCAVQNEWGEREELKLAR